MSDPAPWRPPSPGDRGSLARCVGDPDAFLSACWATAAHLRRGEDYSDLLAPADVDHLLSSTAMRYPAFRVVKDGRTLPASACVRSARVGSKPLTDLIDVARVLEQFAGGATIVLQGLHRYWQPVTRFCLDLERSLTHPVQANAYVTPPVSQGLRVHADPHDVFALQTHGHKQWVVHADGADAPATLDVRLEAGDALYLPRGMAHAARTVDAPSIHLTIGVRPATWADALRPLLGAVLDDPALDEALPPGYASDPAGLAPALAERIRHVADRIAGAASAPLADAAAVRFWAKRTPQLAGQLVQLLELDTLDDDSVLERRADARLSIRRIDGRVVADLGDRQLRMPAELEPALRMIAAFPRLRVGDLRAHLDEQSRLVLVRRLVREALLLVVRD